MNQKQKRNNEKNFKYLISISFGLLSLVLIGTSIGILLLIQGPEQGVASKNAQLVIPQESVKGVNETQSNNTQTNSNLNTEERFDFQGTIFTKVRGNIIDGWSISQTVENNGLAERFVLSKNDVEIIISVSQPFDVGNVNSTPCYVSFDKINPELARVEYAKTNENKRRFRYFSDYTSVLFFPGNKEFETIKQSQQAAYEYVACGTTTIPFISAAPQTQKQIREGKESIAWLYIDVYGNNMATILEADTIVAEMKY